MLRSVSQGDAPHTVYRFGAYVLDLDRESLARRGREIRLRPKSFAVLAYLVKHHGRLVTKEELLAAVWGHVHVTEGSLTQCLIEIRRALADRTHETIRTVQRRGFIFEPQPTLHAVAPAGKRAATGWIRRRYIAVGAIALVLVAAGGWWGTGHLGYRNPQAPSAGRPTAIDSIAVLPFMDLTRSGGYEYFADGLSEEVLNSLTQVPGLKVIARTSSFAFKGKRVDIPTVADRLHVAHVLEGSVRKSGNLLRITVQLVDAKTDTHLWSRTFDRQLGDVFTVQTEIAGLVAQTLKLSRSEHGNAAAARPPDPKAYEHFLRGEFFWYRRSTGDRELAEQEFRQAVRLDPEFARAWVALAGAYYVRNLQAQSPDADWLTRFHDLLQQALSADPNLAEAYARMAAYYSIKGDPVNADENWQKAQALDPDSVLVLGMGAGWAAWRGLYAEAIDLQRRATGVDPLSAMSHANLGTYLLATGDLEAAQAEFRQALTLSPSFAPDASGFETISDQLVLIRILQHRYEKALTMALQQPDSPRRAEHEALIYWRLGRGPEFRAAVDRMIRGGGLGAEFRMAEVAAFRGATDEAFGHLRALNARLDVKSANSQTQEYIQEIRVSALFIGLRADPRWDALWDKWRRWM